MIGHSLLVIHGYEVEIDSFSKVVLLGIREVKNIINKISKDQS